MIAARLGTEWRQDDTVIGDAVNIASRLCDLAVPGTLLTDLQTASLGGDLEGFEPTRTIQIKGKEGVLAVATWRPPIIPVS